jgi:hypothetical protein
MYNMFWTKLLPPPLFIPDIRSFIVRISLPKYHHLYLKQTLIHSLVVGRFNAIFRAVCITRQHKDQVGSQLIASIDVYNKQQNHHTYHHLYGLGHVARYNSELLLKL